MSWLDTLLEGGIKAANALIVNPKANISGIVQQTGARIVSGVAPSASGIYETGVVVNYVTGRLQELNADAREVRDKRNQAQTMGQKAYAAAFDAWLSKDFPAAVQALTDLSTRVGALMLDPGALEAYKSAAIARADAAHARAVQLVAAFTSFVRAVAADKALHPVRTAAEEAAKWLAPKVEETAREVGQKVSDTARDIVTSPTGALLLTGAVGLAAFYLLAPALGQFAGGYVTARRAR